MIKLLKYFLKPLFLYLTDGKSRRLIHLKARYSSIKKYQLKSINFDDYQITVPDVPSFLDQYETIFFHEAYAFLSDLKSPLIYDCGANIGMGVLFWKKQFSDAEIIAFEADPIIAMVLKTNIEKNNLKGVTVFNTAVWVNEEGVSFHQEGGQGGKISLEDNIIHVPSVRLKEVLMNESRTIDFLKIDIEGAEFAVIKDCEEELKKVKHLFIEVHFSPVTKNDFSKVLRVLENQDFRYFIQNKALNHPFIEQTNSLSKFSIELFAVRK